MLTVKILITEANCTNKVYNYTHNIRYVHPQSAQFSTLYWWCGIYNPPTLAPEPPEAFRGHPRKVHRELAAEFGELPTQHVEGRECSAGVGLILYDS